MSTRSNGVRLRRPLLWLVIFVVMAAVVVLNAVAPDDNWVGLAEDAVAAGGAVVIWVHLLRRGVAARAGWIWLAGSVSCWVIGDLVWDGYALLGLQRPDVSLADLFYLVGYPLLVVGLVRMVRQRAAGRAREGLLDGVALGVAAAVLSWQFVVVPLTHSAESTFTAAVWGAYPFLDVLVLAAFVWLALISGGRSPATKLLLASLAITLVVDTLYSALPIWWPSFDVARLDPLYPLSYLLLMAAVLDVDARELTTPARDPRSRMPAGRVVVLGGALAAVPLAVATQGSTTAWGSRAFVVCASLAVCAIVLVRLVLAVRERETAHEELAHRATHDDLTGLVNRALLLDRIEAAIARRDRSDEPIAALYVDLDRFKSINDTWGHSVGDVVLIEIAARLRSAVRPADTVARVGGDEFIVICEQTDARTASAIAERIAKTVNEPIRVGEVALRTSASIGIAHADAAHEPEQLIRDSDAAMYAAKRMGPGGTGVFDGVLQASNEARREMELALITALGNHDLQAVYQPIVQLRNGDVIGFEALARWTLPGVGPVAPSEFIALAEDAGLILSLGEWMLKEACGQIVESANRSWFVSVNVSAKQFANGELARTVQRILNETGADPERLLLEITESVLIGDMQSALRQLDVLATLGVKIAVDDFGTGYSGLSYLRQFPITIVKLDRSFLNELNDVTQPIPVVVKAVVQLAHALGYTVVAEGVETVQQREMLSACACDWAQGFYFGPPLAADDATKLSNRTNPGAALTL